MSQNLVNNIKLKLKNAIKRPFSISPSQNIKKQSMEDGAYNGSIFPVEGHSQRASRKLLSHVSHYINANE